MTTHYSPAPPKGALKSKTVWSASLGVLSAMIPLLGALGVLPFDISFDPDTGSLSINVYSVAGALAVVGTTASGPLSILARVVGKRAIRGLW